MRPQELGKLRKWYKRQTAKLNADDTDIQWQALVVWDSVVGEYENLTYKEAKRTTQGKTTQRVPNG